MCFHCLYWSETCRKKWPVQKKESEKNIRQKIIEQKIEKNILFVKSHIDIAMRRRSKICDNKT